jgi:hypothetical protein
MEPLFFAGRQNPGREFALQHRLAAGKGYAPARFLVVGTVAQDILQKLVRRYVPALQNQGRGKTLGGAGAAAAAQLPVDTVFAVFRYVRFFGTDRETAAAAYTARRIKFYLWFYGQRFGVVAPYTTATATLKKYRCPYSRTIVYRKTLYIENDAFTMHAALNPATSITPLCPQMQYPE